MSKEKQIEEMAKVIYGGRALCKSPTEVALVLYHAGYRKQSEGEWIDIPLCKTITVENIPLVRCSNCDISFCDILNNHHFMYHYCPHCGTKMKGGAE